MEGDEPDMGPALAPTPDGTATLIRVHVSPGAKGGSQVKGYDSWRKAQSVAVAAPAQEGQANAELSRLLADALGVSARSVRVIEGQKARLKRVRVEGLGVEQAHKRISKDHRLSP